MTSADTVRPVPQSLALVSTTLRAREGDAVGCVVVGVGLAVVGVGVGVGLPLVGVGVGVGLAVVGVGVGVVGSGVGDGVETGTPLTVTVQVIPSTAHVVGCSAPVPTLFAISPNCADPPLAIVLAQDGPEIL